MPRQNYYGTLGNLLSLPSGSKPAATVLCVITDYNDVPTGQIYVGTGITTDPIPLTGQSTVARSVRTVPEGYARMRSYKTGSNISFSVTHDGGDSATGVCYSRSGATPVYTAVASNTPLALSVTHNNGGPVDIDVWPATSATSGRVGNITALSISDESLVSFDADLPALIVLVISSNSLTSFDADLPALTHLDISSNSLTSFDADLPALTILDISNNSLTSVRAVGFVLSTPGSSISNNDLDATALNQFYTDLGVDAGATGMIGVSGNPGTTGDDPTIATAKGYTIVGT